MSFPERTVETDTLQRKAGRVARWRAAFRTESGFTLPEILVSVGIVGVLAAIAIPVTLNQQSRAADVATRSDLTTASTAIESALLTWRGAPVEGTLNICQNDPTYPSENDPTTTCDEGEWKAIVSATGEDATPALGGRLSAGTIMLGQVAWDGTYCLEAWSTRMGASRFHTTSETGQIEEGSCFDAGWVPPSGEAGGGDTTTSTLPDAPTNVEASVVLNVATISWSAAAGATYSVQVTSQPIKIFEANTTGTATCYFPAATCAGPASGYLPPGSYTATVREQGEDGWGPGTVVDFAVVTTPPTDGGGIGDGTTVEVPQIGNVFGSSQLHQILFVEPSSTALNQYLSTSAGREDFQRLVFSSPQTVLTNAGAMGAIAGSATALDMLLINPVVSGAFTLSNVAMNAIIDNPTALASVVGSRNAMTSVVSSPAALATAVNSTTAMTSITASATAMSVVSTSAPAVTSIATTPAALAILAANSGAVTTVANSPTAVTALTNDPEALTAFVTLPAALDRLTQSFTAVNAIAASSTARTAILGDEDARALILTRPIALGKIAAAQSGLEPSQYSDAATLVSSAVAMTSVANNATARGLLVESPVGQSLIARNDTALAKVAAGIAGIDASSITTAANFSGARLVSLFGNEDAWDLIATSPSAMSALASSSTSVRTIARNASIYNDLFARDAALDEFASNTTSRNILLSEGVSGGQVDSGNALANAIRSDLRIMAKFLAGSAGLPPEDYATFTALTSDASAWGSVVQSANAMTLFAQAPYAAQDEVIASGTAAESTLLNSDMALAKIVAGQSTYAADIPEYESTGTSAADNTTPVLTYLDPAQYTSLRQLLTSSEWRLSNQYGSPALGLLSDSPRARSVILADSEALAALLTPQGIRSVIPTAFPNLTTAPLSRDILDSAAAWDVLLSDDERRAAVLDSTVFRTAALTRDMGRYRLLASNDANINNLWANGEGGQPPAYYIRNNTQALQTATPQWWAAIADSPAARTAILASADARGVLLQNAPALDVALDNPDFRSAIIASTAARTDFQASDLGMAKLVSSFTGSQRDYARVIDLVRDSTQMNALLALNSASVYQSLAGSQRAMEALVGNYSAYQVPTPGSAPLYTFTSATFGTCGATGRTGPATGVGGFNAACTFTGQSSTWYTDTNNFSILDGGYQRWVAPRDGMYQFVVRGASGGQGNGFAFTAQYPLVKGEELIFLVGQAGLGAGGGGGTFVARGTGAGSIPLFVAGGGAGRATGPVGNANGNSGMNGNDGASGPRGALPGGRNGAGGGAITDGRINSWCESVPAEGGAGFYGNGQGSPTNSPGSYVNGGRGSLKGPGGFGGGGGGNREAGGGGGGYSGGGAGGGGFDGDCVGGGSGGGGGSFSLTGWTNPTTNSGAGSITVSLLTTDPTASTPVDLTALDELSTSVVAMNALLSDPVASNVLLNSEPALNMIAESEAAVNTLLSNPTLLNTFVASETARDTLMNTETSRTLLQASEIGTAKVLAAEAGYSPIVYSVTSQLVSNSTLFDAILASPAALDFFAGSAPARTAVFDNSTARLQVATSEGLLTKLVAAAGGGNTASFNTYAQLFGNSTVFGAAAADPSAMALLSRSTSGMTALAANGSAFSLILPHTTTLQTMGAATEAMNSIAASSTAMNLLVGDTPALSTVLGFNAAQSAFASTNAAAQAIAGNTAAVNLILGNSTRMDAFTSQPVARAAFVGNSVARGLFQENVTGAAKMTAGLVGYTPASYTATNTLAASAPIFAAIVSDSTARDFFTGSSHGRASIYATAAAQNTLLQEGNEAALVKTIVGQGGGDTTAIGTFDGLFAASSVLTTAGGNASAMSLLARSTPGMTALLANQTAFTSLFPSVNAMQQFGANSVSANAIAADATSMAALASNATAVTNVLSQGTAQSSFAVSATASAALAGSADAINYILAQTTRINVFAAQPTARAAFLGNPVSRGLLQNNVAGAAKITAGLVGYAPASYSTTNSLASSAPIFNAIVADPTARDFFTGSSHGRTSIYAYTSAINTVLLEANESTLVKTIAGQGGGDTTAISTFTELYAAPGVLTSAAGNASAASLLARSPNGMATLIADNAAFQSVVPITTAMQQFAAYATSAQAIAGSATAMSALAATPSSLTTMMTNATANAAFVDSATASTQIAATPAAVSHIIADTTRLNTYAGSATARAALLSNAAARASLQANNAATAKILAGEAGGNPASFSTTAAVIANGPLSDAIAAWSDDTRVTFVAGASNARNAILSDTTAQGKVQNNESLVVKMAAAQTGRSVEPGQAASFSTYSQLFASAPVFGDVVGNANALTFLTFAPGAMTGLSSNATAFGTALGSSTARGVLRVSPNAMTAISQSATAMPILAASNHLVDFVTNETAMNFLAGESFSRNLLLATEQSRVQLYGSNLAMAKVLASSVSLAPTLYSNLDSVVTSAPTMAAIAADATTVGHLAGSNLAMTAAAAQATSMNALAGSSAAMTVLAASASAMSAIAAESVAQEALTNSTAAMTIAAQSTTAMNAIALDANFRTRVYESTAALDIVRASSMAVAKLIVGFNQEAGIELAPGGSAPWNALYPFSSHTFTNCGAEGRFGPPIADCRTAYSGATWAQNNDYFRQGPFQGYQEWVVPADGIYRITAAGASGGYGGSFAVTARPGYGAVMRGDFELKQGEVVRIVVGQEGLGNPYGGGLNGHERGGGGGTFVTTSSNDPLVVAGGGGGIPGAGGGWGLCTNAQLSYRPFAGGQITQTPQSPSSPPYAGSGTCDGNLGVNVWGPSMPAMGIGQGGDASASQSATCTVYGQNGCPRRTGSSPDVAHGGPGGGFYGNAERPLRNCGVIGSHAGIGFVNGATGGQGDTCYTQYNHGGFGGGGGGNVGGPGAGGGWTGGPAASTGSPCSGSTCNFNPNDIRTMATFGGGGGSINFGSNQQNIADTQFGHGYVEVQWLSSPPTFALPGRVEAVNSVEDLLTDSGALTVSLENATQMSIAQSSPVFLDGLIGLIGNGNAVPNDAVSATVNAEVGRGSTPSEYTFTLDEPTSIDLMLYGAQGGGWPATPYNSGGFGAGLSLSGTLPAGDYRVVVGNKPRVQRAAGLPGGGLGGYRTAPDREWGWGGGGYTALYDSADNLLAVAGAGGGYNGAIDKTSTYGLGGQVGTNGGQESLDCTNGPLVGLSGRGATQSAGGAPGPVENASIAGSVPIAATAGSYLQGGDGTTSGNRTDTGMPGAGGGGGYYGGGGGTGARVNSCANVTNPATGLPGVGGGGGGGGSSWADPAVFSSIEYVTGGQSEVVATTAGDGLAILGSGSTGSGDPFEQFLLSATAIHEMTDSAFAMAQFFANEEATAAIVASETAMTAIAQSENAATALAASPLALEAVAANEDAITLLAASNTAWPILVASSSAMSVLPASEVARDAIAGTPSAMAAVGDSTMALGKFLAGYTQADPAAVVGIEALLSDPVLMGEVAASAPARTALLDASISPTLLAQSATAMTVLSSNSDARTAVAGNSSVMDEVFLSDMATTKLLAGFAGLDPNAYASLSVLLGSGAATQIGGNSTATDILFDSTLARPILLASPAVYDALVQTQYGEAKFLSVEFLEDAVEDVPTLNMVAASSAARTGILEDEDRFDVVRGDTMAMAKILAGGGGGNPAEFVNVTSLLVSPTVWGSVVADDTLVSGALRSASVWSDLKSNDTALTQLLSSSVARPILRTTPSALAEINGSTAAKNTLYAYAQKWSMSGGAWYDDYPLGTGNYLVVRLTQTDNAGGWTGDPSYPGAGVLINGATAFNLTSTGGASNAMPSYETGLPRVIHNDVFALNNQSLRLVHYNGFEIAYIPD